MLFDRFHAKYHKWQVWNDFLYLSAVAMANVFPSREKKEREVRYCEIMSRYSIEYQILMSRLFAVVVAALDENPEQDFLGAMYHKLGLHQQQKGQFFTPYNISHMMAEMQFAGGAEQERGDKGYITVSDPACGAGAMLIAFANVARRHGINYQRAVLFVGQDIDQTAALMCYIQLSILGCPAIIIVGDSLVKPDLHPDNPVWYTPFLFLNRWKFRDFLEDTVTDLDGKSVKQAKKQDSAA